MQVNFEQTINDFDGEPIPYMRPGPQPNTVMPVLDKDGKPQPLTLRLVSINSLMQLERDIDGAEKCKRDQLAGNIYQSKGVVELEVEDVALLKKLIDKNYQHPRVVSAAWQMLDPSPGSTEDKPKRNKK